jgi:uncharacterized protein (TIGR03067 family)
MSCSLIPTLILVLAAPPARAAEADPEPPVAGAKAIQGRWTLDRVIGEGPGKPPAGLVLMFEKDKLSVKLGKDRVDKVHSFKIDPRKKPGHLDLVDSDRGRSVEGIYKIEKGELFICIGERSGKRPTAFDGKVEPVLILKKQKK